MVKPRISTVRRGNARFADKAVAFVRSVGMDLDEWQEKVLRASLLEKGGRWSAMDIGLNVARQNGKGEVIIARILVELYLVGSQLTIYSAHNFGTAMEHFRRLVTLIEDSPRLLEEVLGQKGQRPYGITWGKGNEGVELVGNRRFHIRTRTAGGGRGFSSDLLILDEAMFLSEFFNSALRPIISARPKPQIWTTGSAVDQTIHENGVVFARIRESAIADDDPDLTYFEWSAGNGVPLEDNPDMFSDLADRAAWAQANPALGIRIDPKVVDGERRRMSDRGFAVERLGIGDWPRTDHVSSVIDIEAWLALADETSVLRDPVCFAYDVSPDRQTSVSAAGRNQHGGWHVEVIENRKGTGWLPERLAELNERWSPLAVVCDGYGPAGSLVPAVEEAGVAVETLTASEHSQACGQFVDAIADKTLAHLGSQELAAAIRAAGTRPLGDAWAWSRKGSSANISPLVSATLALSAVMFAAPNAEGPRMVSLA